MSLLRGSKGADEYALYKRIRNARFGELSRAILYLKRKKLIHISGYRKNSRTGIRIPIYSFGSKKASFDSKFETTIVEELIGGLSFERSVEYDFVARNFSPTKNRMRILDVGSEMSELTRIISRFGLQYRWEVCGIDISKFERVADDKKTLPLFVQMDARYMGFRNNLFDIVLCISIFEHLGIELLDQSIDKINIARSDVKALSEIFRILRKGGRVLFTVPYIDDKIQGYTKNCRIYNSQMISKLTRSFKIKKEEFYIYVNGIWRRCKRKHLTRELGLCHQESLPNHIESRVLLCLMLEK